MAAPLANSTNRLRVTLTDQNLAAVNNATVTVVLTKPDGTSGLASTSVPFVSNGVYELVVGPNVLTVNGTWTATWNAVDGGGRTWHHVELFIVTL